MDLSVYEKIISKKEFSQLPKIDVEKAYSHFEKREVSDEEKIRLTRELLHKVYGAFSSPKLLGKKKIDIEKILRKHISTRERLPYYGEVYSKILGKRKREIHVIDLGAGVNGLSYKYMEDALQPIKYVGVDGIGQFVNLTNKYFEKEKISGKVYHASLFELEKIKKIIKEQKGEKIVFLFKVVDNLEMLERDYSKKLLKEIVPLVDKIVVSFATRSLLKHEKFKANRKWFEDFVNEEFILLDDVEIGGERYMEIAERK